MCVGANLGTLLALVSDFGVVHPITMIRLNSDIFFNQYLMLLLVLLCADAILLVCAGPRFIRYVARVMKERRSDERRKKNECVECGYSLRGLSERRCPECGTPF